MHQARPFGLHVIGLPITDKDEAFISNVAVRITNLKKVSGVDSMKMVYDLPDGGYVIVQDMGGNFRVIAHKPLPEKDVVFDGLAGSYIPMLYSGVITKAIVYESQPVELRLTEEARNRVRNYNSTQAMPPKDIGLQRFRVDYADKFQEFKPPLASIALLRTQYDQLRPTWYSGAMAEVMQIVGGYGRQDINNLPNNDFERAVIRLPPNVAKNINDEIDNLRLAGFTGIPSVSGACQYDYKFNNTNGVGFDSSNKPWLLQVGSSGVWAMPLPLIPATTTKAFKLYMEQVQDNEIISILNRFGGMPSGETFPTGNSFQAWRRAGVIIKVCDTSDFYSHIAYSSACGWSFNNNATEGYNTCYEYYDEIGYGSTYKLSLSLAPAKNHIGEGVEDISPAMLPERVQRVQRYLNELIPTLDLGSGEARAVLYKLRRVGYYVIHERSLMRKGDWDADYWHNLELDPIANHSGNVVEVYGNWLYHPAKFEYQPQIKFPEPFMGACMSHDFLPLKDGRYRDQYPNADTIMFAYFIGNNLKVIKYFIDFNDFYKDEVEGNFEQYMTAGSWKQTQSVGLTSIQGNFYSSDIDDRDLVSPSIVTTTIKGEDAGYDSKPFFEFDDFFVTTGTLFRHRYHTHDTLEKRTVNLQVELAVCIPYFCRNATIQTQRESSAQRESGGTTLYAVRDPHSYRYWTYDSIWAWRAGDIRNQKGVPIPKNGSPVWVEDEDYNPSPANNFADSGPWVTGLPQDYTWLIHPKQDTWNHSGGGGPPSFENTSWVGSVTSSESGRVSVSINQQPVVVNRYMPDNKYYIGSPSEIGFLFYRDATAVVFGDTVYSNVSEKNTRSSRASFGYCSLVDNKSAHHFIGVINE